MTKYMRNLTQIRLLEQGLRAKGVKFITVHVGGGLYQITWEA